MKKIMILGASSLQLPAILKAKEMGLYVVAVDMDINAIGFEVADVSLNISTTDIQKVSEVAKRYQIDGIITLASDRPMRTVAMVAKELNIPGISIDTAFKATDKILMRNCLRDNNVPIPKFYKVSNEKEYFKALSQFSSSVIIKPADSSGSRGVALIKDLDDIKLNENAYLYSKNNSNSGEVIVEEYMQGLEVSVETISVEGEVHIIGITDKVTNGAPHFVEMGHSQPSKLDENVKRKISEIAISAVKAIGIKNGPSHTEIMVTKDGPKIIELGARLGGDNITSHLTPLSTGIDMIECSINIALGNKPDLSRKFNKGAAIKYFKPGIGKIIDIKGIEEAKSINGVNQIKFTKFIGENSEQIKNSHDRIGFVITQSTDVKGAIAICEQVIKKIKIKIN